MIKKQGEERLNRKPLFEVDVIEFRVFILLKFLTCTSFGFLSVIDRSFYQIDSQQCFLYSAPTTSAYPGHEPKVCYFLCAKES